MQQTRDQARLGHGPECPFLGEVEHDRVPGLPTEDVGDDAVVARRRPLHHAFVAVDHHATHHRTGVRQRRRPTVSPSRARSQGRLLVAAAQQRVEGSGLETVEDNGTCCYAVQDKVWVEGPDNARWEIPTVLADADELVCAPDGPAT